jgi:hypothetical protein
MARSYWKFVQQPTLERGIVWFDILRKVGIKSSSLDGAYKALTTRECSASGSDDASASSRRLPERRRALLSRPQSRRLR